MFSDSYVPEINGVVTSIVGTVAALRRRGHRIIVVAPAHDAATDDDPDVFRFRSTPFPFYPQFRMAFPLPAKLLATLPRLPFDVIHTHSLFFVGCLGAYLAQFRRLPLFFTYHTRWTEYAHYLPLDQRITQVQAVWISREYSNRCDRVIAPTAGVEAMLRSYGVDKPVDIIPAGVDLASFAGGATAPEAIKERAGGPILLYAGRLGKEKNLDFLLDAFELIGQKSTAARLIIVGGGPYDDHLRERAKGMKCGNRTEFTGPLDQPDLGSYYRAADAFAFSSKSETQGLVLIEAMAHGVPVVAVDSEVSREVVGSDAGLLVPERAEAFADAAVALLHAGPEERERRAAAARAAAAPFGVDALAAKLESLYLQECSGRASARP